MASTHPDWDLEQERVRFVLGVIESEINKLLVFEEHARAEVVEIRRDFWEDVTVNFDDAHEVAETYASIRQQAEVLGDRERGHRQAALRLRALHRLRESPYFGRIDFLADEEAAPDEVYLGVSSLKDNQENHLVYDWRAPIASLYYDSQPGEVSFEAPVGRIHGTMTKKRQYVIRDGNLRAMFDADVTIGDALLREVLGLRSDGQMKSIVATIQREQNEIIRDEYSPLLVVVGAAGSGKTSTALQRMAYLLYRYRDSLEADNILLFSPNPIFKTFVSTVLPDLGEENMRQTTFQEYLEHRLASQFSLENPFAQLEYVLTREGEEGYQSRLRAIRYKSGQDFIRVLDSYVESLARSGMVFRPLRFRGESIVTTEEMKDVFYGYEASWSAQNRVRRLKEWLSKEVKQRLFLQRTEKWVDDEIDLLDKEDYAKAFENLHRQNRFRQGSFDDFRDERDYLANLVIGRHVKRLRKRVNRLRFIDMPAIYRALFTESWPNIEFHLDDEIQACWSEICEQTVDSLNKSHLLYEDMTPYLYLQERIEGFDTNLSIRHVFVDEAQDYSPFQFSFIKRLFPRSRLTVLGDANQTIFAHSSSTTDLFALPKLLSESNSRIMTLQTSYRSTRQIVEFAREILTSGQTIRAFERNGNLPTIHVVDEPVHLNRDILEVVQAWMESHHRRIAIITKTFNEAQEVYQAQSGRMPMQLVDTETAVMKSRVVVLPVYLAKGVEFDAVVVYNPSASTYNQHRDRFLLYTACTRAMHSLHLSCMGHLSPFVANINKALYRSND